MLEIKGAEAIAVDMLGEIRMHEGAGEKDFLLAAIAITGEMELPTSIPRYKVIHAAFRQKLNPAIETTPGRSWGRVVMLTAYLEENDLVRIGSNGAELTDSGKQMYKESVEWPPLPSK